MADLAWRRISQPFHPRILKNSLFFLYQNLESIETPSSPNVTIPNHFTIRSSSLHLHTSPATRTSSAHCHNTIRVSLSSDQWLPSRYPSNNLHQHLMNLVAESNTTIKEMSSRRPTSDPSSGNQQAFPSLTFNLHHQSLPHQPLPENQKKAPSPDPSLSSLLSSANTKKEPKQEISKPRSSASCDPGDHHTRPSSLINLWLESAAHLLG